MHTTTGHWRLGLLLALTTSLLWGLLPIAIEIVLTDMDAYTITWWRFVMSAAGLGAYLGWRRQLPAIASAGRLGWALLLFALLTMIANFVLYVVALDLTSPSVAQVLIQIAPLLLLLGGVFLFHEPFAPRQWLGFLLLGAGLLLFFNRRLPELAEPTVGLGLGVVVMLAASISWACYGLAQKRLLLLFSPPQVLWLLFTGATLLLWPAARPAQLLDLNELQLWMLAFCGANTLIAYGAFGEALRHWEISRVSAILATAPLFTIISMWLIGWSGWNLVAPEGLNTASVLGALVVITGSMICALAARPAP